MVITAIQVALWNARGLEDLLQKKHGTYLLVPAYYEAWASLFRRRGSLLLGHWAKRRLCSANVRKEGVYALRIINVWATMRPRKSAWAAR